MPPTTPPAAAQPARTSPTEPDVVHHDGDLDAAGVERLRAVLGEVVGPRRHVVLDVSRAQHVSYAALAVLVATHCRLRDSGGQLVLRHPTPAVVRVLRISGLHRVLAVEAPPPARTAKPAARSAAQTRGGREQATGRGSARRGAATRAAAARPRVSPASRD